ncbi:MAG TPA: alpha/beta hydrolase [Gammaproteobacteria bacterium]|nr:alpha/beta hydrolase [Gammaproteobacteria bacterium]
MKAFLDHIRHRPIYRIGAIYLAIAWLLMQITVSIEAPLSLPSWADTLVIVILAIGFPVALLLAWAGEHKRAELAAAPHSAAAGPGTQSTSAVQQQQSDIRFCTTPSGHRLAYSRAGSGFPVLRTGNWLSHVGMDRKLAVFSHMYRDFSQQFELICYDGRGTGLSDRDVELFSLETMVEDMEAVADANGLDKFAILAFSQSCAVAVAYAARHPDRVTHMVFFGGFIRNFRPQEEIDAMATLFERSWGQTNPGTRQIFTTALFPDAGKREIDDFNELQRLSVSPQNAARLFRAAHAIDVREEARRVSVPTLVMHSRDEEGVSMELGREIASLIPNSRFVVLESKNHIILEHEPAYQQFLDEAVSFINSGVSKDTRDA